MSTSKPLALVTGASRGIGAAIAEKLGALGFHVIVNFNSNEEKAQAVVKKIKSAGGEATPLKFNVAKEEEIVGAFDAISKMGSLAVLVNNAGVSEDSLILRLKKETVDLVLETNLMGSILCAREASRLMLKARAGGSIIQITSVVGESGNAGQVAYSAAKAGLMGLTKSLAKELASRQIRVNAVSPGYISTDMTSALNDTQKAKIIENIPLGMIGEASDVAELVGFLSIPASRYITGQVISVNGGLYI